MVVQNNNLVLDERAVLPGRGAWLHPTPECFDAAMRRRAFARALRVPHVIGFPEAADAQTIEQYCSKNKG
ncbi:COG2740: Predicted nucleic-acid-binding protein implicated in transcription termination [Microbacterium esteraromaticum]|uniref:COG2740: Predicted nucleic-acid-binding protein implicated in transcription termination n=1 Tax=Microbacterium esteraromaticum TaxID=57043 RepID=A0A1R4JJH6_9MICO|nr:COG2740: Predicted nucleic-acid-binding protein implicated in transcription termination [Microbacterium esteraromaticum]